MTQYTLVQRPNPGLWKHEYWPYVATNQCLTLCIRRYAAAIEAGDLSAAQQEWQFAQRLLKAANECSPSPMLLSADKPTTTIEAPVPEHDTSPVVHGTAMPDVPIAGPFWPPEIYAPMPVNARSASISRHPETFFTRYAEKMMTFVMFAILGFFLAGCLTFLLNQFTAFSIAMTLAAKILWRLVFIGGAVFITGAIMASLTSK